MAMDRVATYFVGLSATLIDRIHPDLRSGSWPPLVSNPRVFAYEATMHALFGVVLGLLHPAARDRNRLDAPYRI